MSIQASPTALSDFTNSTGPGSNPYVLAGGRYEQGIVTPIYFLDKTNVPVQFPMQAWVEQSTRYTAFWAWFNGTVLNDTRQNAEGETEFRFPLRINSLRDIVRKNTSVLFGEAPDGPTPLVSTSVRARTRLTGDAPKDEDYKFAKLCENIVNEVWLQSDGRSIQQEGGELCQFLGGHFYQICYESWNQDVDIPVFIRSWRADLVLPIWQNNNYWDLSEVYIVYRLETTIANATYNMKKEGSTFCFYVEHWTKDKYSIFIDNTPVTMVVNGESITFDDLDNPFGFVPFVYVPHLREGSFYGSSHVPDLAGLIEEYNASMANLGDAINNSIERERYIRNSPQRTLVQLPSGKMATNLGVSNPAAHDPPDAFVEDPPNLSPGLITYVDKVYNQIRRSGFLPAVAEGEDEGSQRSGVTLDIRFWPATAHAKTERGFWETGLNMMARQILSICQKKDLFKRIGQPNPKERFLNNLTFNQEWYSQIPRDRQAEVNELLSRLEGNGISLRKFLADIGDVENTEDEEALIREWMTFKASLEIKADPNSESPLGGSSFAKKNDAIDNAP